MGAAFEDLFEQKRHEVKDENGNVVECHFHYFVLKLIAETWKDEYTGRLRMRVTGTPRW